MMAPHVEICANARAEASANAHPTSGTELAARSHRARFLRVDRDDARETLHPGLASEARDLAWRSLDEHGTARSLGPEPHTPCAAESDETLEGVTVDASEAAALRATRSQIVGDLYASAYHRVFAFARRLVCDEEAEEIAHESFVRLLRVRNLERMTVSVAYLLRIAENLIRRRHGRAQRYREVLERSGRMGPDREVHIECSVVASARGGCGASSSMSAWADPERLQSVLCRLTPSEQSAIRLIVCEGLDYQAAARSLGVPVSTINNWKHRALAKLKQIIEEDGLVAPRSRATVEQQQQRMLEAC
jgi:RNA polymerase sigma-70 factor (ECF subfamily)